MSGGDGGPGGAGGVGGGRIDLLTALERGTIQGRENRLRAATALFEGVFMNELFKAMRATVPEGEIGDGGSGEEVFTGLLDQHLADAAALRSEGGIGEALYRHFSRGFATDSPEGPESLKRSGMGDDPNERGGATERAPALPTDAPRGVDEDR